jgi:hypothetical protein
MRTTAIAGATVLVLLAAAGAGAKPKEFTSTFGLETCRFATTGENPYFILATGHQLVLESGPEADEHEVVTITVLDETEVVAGVTTRVVEERETVDGVLKEVSRNFFAVCEQNGSVVYFGEDVDNYDETGTMVVDHDGAWRAGIGGAEPGIIMPGLPLIGARYYQELAPDVALDRAIVTSVTETVETPAGAFDACVVTKESSALERGARSIKAYAPGVGLIRDDELFLTQVGP